MRDKVCFGLASGLLAAAIVLAAVLFGAATMFGDRGLSEVPQIANEASPNGIHAVRASGFVRPSGD